MKVLTIEYPPEVLWALGRLDLLQALYDEVEIPQAVYDEFLASERALRQVANEA